MTIYTSTGWTIRVGWRFIFHWRQAYLASQRTFAHGAAVIGPFVFRW